MHEAPVKEVKQDLSLLDKLVREYFTLSPEQSAALHYGTTTQMIQIPLKRVIKRPPPDNDFMQFNRTTATNYPTLNQDRFKMFI